MQLYKSRNSKARLKTFFNKISNFSLQSLNNLSSFAQNLMASSGGNSLQMNNNSYSFSNQFMTSSNDIQPRSNNTNKIINNQDIDIEIPKNRPFSPSSFSISPSSFFATTPTFSPSVLLDSPLPFPNFGMAPSTQNRGSYEFTNQAGQPSHSVMVSSTVQPPSDNNSSDQLMMRQQREWAANTSIKQTEEAARENNLQTQYSSQPNQVYHSSQYGKEQKSEDGYNWRKYGQKQVKASENPRSYYKCTYVNCPTKKMVERNIDGQITEIVYKGSHNHPKPQSTRRSSSQSSFNNPAFVTGSEMPNNHSNGLFDNHQRDSAVVTPEHSSTSFDDDDVEAGSRMSKSGDVNDINEPEAKRWRGEHENEAISASASRTVREPRIVVQTTSDIDILDDGYRWRKYGQKVVKGNPNPRSYYKCTFAGCQVRKHIERASHDLRAVITTYEGKHNHDVPAARGSARYNSNAHSAVTNNSIVTTAIRPSAINNLPNQGTNYAISLPGMRQPTTQNQPFSLQMLQNSENMRFSGYGNATNLNASQFQQMSNAFSLAKEEPKDDSFFNSF